MYRRWHSWSAGMMLGLLLSLIFGSVALADVGPKPSMDFTFTALTDVQPEIVEATLYECSDPTCATAEPLQELGPQRITCQATHCYSMAYGYAEHFRLSVRFSDGITRESNAFGKRAYQAQYTVRIEDSSLVVEEYSTFGSLFSGPLFILALFTLGAAVLILPLLALLHLVFLGIWIARAPRPEAPPWWLFTVTWIFSGLGIVIGLIAAFTVPLTLLIELPVLIAYARWRDKPLKLWLTLGVATNLVTQPLLWSMAIGGGLRYFPWGTLAIVEVGIWLVEAVLLYLPLRRQATFPAMLRLSLAMNALSFGLGLLLPV